MSSARMGILSVSEIYRHSSAVGDSLIEWRKAATITFENRS